MRGERARVAERVRALVAASGSAEAEPAAPAASLSSRLSSRLSARWPARWPVRIDPGRRGALAVAAVAVAVAVVTGAWVLHARPQSVPVSVSAPSAPSVPAVRSPGSAGTAASASGAGPPVRPAAAVGGDSSASGSSGLLVVDVAGKVRRPGLYRLPPGARVADAVAAAGGVQRGVDTTSVNLAARVVDGQQIVIGIAGVPGTGPAADAPASGGSAGGPVSLNTATLAQLQTLPGVGPVLAQHILDWRSQHGSFGSVDQLNDVTGIGEVKFAALKPLVTV